MGMWPIASNTKLMSLLIFYGNTSYIFNQYLHNTKNKKDTRNNHLINA